MHKTAKSVGRAQGEKERDSESWEFFSCRKVTGLKKDRKSFEFEIFQWEEEEEEEKRGEEKAWASFRRSC